MRDMKWHIYGKNHQPLCWDGMALEFESKEDAQNFLDSCFKNADKEEDFWATINIVKDILFYDGGYLDATNKIVLYDNEECDIVLTTKE